MKMVKKVAALVAGFALCGSVFAQTSYLYDQTNGASATDIDKTIRKNRGLFRLDVDNFMDENEWFEVKANNGYGFLGYNFEGNKLSLGLAKQFKDFYGSVYFGGNFDSFTTSASTTTNNSTGNRTSTSNLTSGNDGAFTFAALAGIANMGFKFAMDYTPTNINNTDNSDGTKNYTEQFLITPALSWGMNTKVNKHNAKFYAGTNLNCNVNKTDVNGNKDDDSTYVWNIYANAEFSKKSKSVVQTSYGTAFMIDFNFEGNDQTVKEYGKFENLIAFDPYFVAGIKPVDIVEFKARAHALVSFTNQFATRYTVNGGTTSYETDRTDHVLVGISPILDLGAVVQLKKNVAQFNIGASFDVPTMVWDNNYRYVCDANSGVVTSQTAAVDYSFLSNTGAVELHSGFTVFIGKNVTIDTNWDLVGNIFDGFTTKFMTNADETNGTNVFFGNFSQILFGSNIGILVSVKF